MVLVFSVWDDVDDFIREDCQVNNCQLDEVGGNRREDCQVNNCQLDEVGDFIMEDGEWLSAEHKLTMYIIQV